MNEDIFDLTPFCEDDNIYCICRNCKDNVTNEGGCNHCFSCINGYKAMDTCEFYIRR